MAKHQANHIQVAYAPRRPRPTARSCARRRWRSAHGHPACNLCGDFRAYARPPPGPGVPVRGAAPSCALGLDFGTASVRAVIVDTRPGASAGPPSRTIGTGSSTRRCRARRRRCRPDWALQHPADYWSRSRAPWLARSRRPACSKPRRSSGSASTSRRARCCRSTRRGRPLCLDAAIGPRGRTHGSSSGSTTPRSRRRIASMRRRPRARRSLPRHYGGRTSSEWLAAKALQVLDDDPEVLRGDVGIVEAGDWVVGAAHRRAACATRAARATRDSGVASGLSLRRTSSARSIRASANLRREARQARSSRRAGASAGLTRRRWPHGSSSHPARRWRPRSSTRTAPSRPPRWSRPGAWCSSSGPPRATCFSPIGHALVEGRRRRREATASSRASTATKPGSPRSATSSAGSRGLAAGGRRLRGARTRRRGGPARARAACSRSTGGTAIARCSSTPISPASSSGLTLSTTRRPRSIGL